jgi:hypothetical protein
MKKNVFLPLIIIVLLVFFFFNSFFLQGNLPIPSDTIEVLYHPFIDYSATHFPNGVHVKNILITDPVRQQYPWRWLAVSLEKGGQLPLWNPYTFAGTPLFANFQTAAFYPLNILLFILPFSFGWSILILIELLFAGFFLYLYLSNLHLRYSARFLGSIVFMFCGFMTSWLEWNTLDQVVLWLPLILLSIDKILIINNKGLFSIRSRWSLVLLIALTCSFFGGHLQPFFYLALITVCYFFARWVQFGKSKNALLFAIFLASVFVIISAIQWLPTLQFIVFSARNTDLLNSWRMPGWFIPWQNLAQFIAPDFFGNPTTLNYWGIWNYGEFIGYVGIFPLIMALFALFYRRDKKTFFFGTFFFLSLLFSLPTIFAEIPYLLNIPFISTSQPTRLLFITDFSLSILAALGLDYYLSNGVKKKIVYPNFFIFIIIAGLWYIALFGYKQMHITPNESTVSKHNLYFPTVLFFLSALALCFNIYAKNNKIKSSIIIILLLLTCIDLFRFSDKFNPFTQRLYLFPQTQALSYLQNQKGQFRIMATSSEILPPNFSVMYHLQSLDGYDPLYLQRYGEFISAIMQNKPDINSPIDFHRIITPQDTKSRLIDLFGVKYILTLSNPHEPKLKKVFSEGKTNIYENLQAFPRVFFVRNVKPVTDKSEAINELFNPHVNLHQTAVVEDWDGHSILFGSGTTTITRYQANSIVITEQSATSTFLVLTDTFYPTWHVMVDGKEGKIYRTDYNFRGIELQPGNHHVVFYDSLL